MNYSEAMSILISKHGKIQDYEHVKSIATWAGYRFGAMMADMDEGGRLTGNQVSGRVAVVARDQGLLKLARRICAGHEGEYTHWCVHPEDDETPFGVVARTSGDASVRFALLSNRGGLVTVSEHSDWDVDIATFPGVRTINRS